MNKNAFSQNKLPVALLFTLLIFSGCQTNLSGNDLSGNLGQVLDNNLTPEQQKIAALEEQAANLQSDLALKNSLLEEFENKNYQLLKQVHPNAFDYNLIKIGEQVGEMTLSASGTQPASVDQEGNQVDAYQYAEFAGTVELTGTYNYYNDQQAFLANQVCFTSLDEASLAKLPLEMERLELPEQQFCFENQDLARQSFGPKGSSGQATIQISSYSSNNSGLQAYPLIELAKVISK
ncbi:MAG: hypothetical protein ACRCZE_03770 [Candidatus Altimarinota bacterium]